MAAIAYLIATSGMRTERLSQYDILKMLFLADKSHLNAYGRPVTFDNYYAMREGPVPSLAYDLLKENRAVIKKHHLTNLPWRKTDQPESGTGIYYYFDADTRDVEQALSESDKELLKDAFIMIGLLTYAQIKRLLHADPAYLEAWQSDATKKAFPISYGMIFDSPDFEAAKTLEFFSKHL